MPRFSFFFFTFSTLFHILINANLLDNAERISRYPVHADTNRKRDTDHAGKNRHNRVHRLHALHGRVHFLRLRALRRLRHDTHLYQLQYDSQNRQKNSREMVSRRIHDIDTAEDRIKPAVLTLSSLISPVI